MRLPAGARPVHGRYGERRAAGPARLKIAGDGTTALFEPPVPPSAQWLRHACARVPPGQEGAVLGWDAFAAGLLTDPDVSAG